MNWVVKTERFNSEIWELPDGAVVIKAERKNYINYDTGTSIEYTGCFFSQPGKIMGSGVYWDVTYTTPEGKKL